MLASPATLHHLLLPAPPHPAFALPNPAPPLHAWLPISRLAPPRVAAFAHSSSRRPRRRDAKARVAAAAGEETAPAVAAEEASSSGPTKFSVKIPVGDRHVSR
jgi:polyribonucleotide nucleotidyltransferase